MKKLDYLFSILFLIIISILHMLSAPYGKEWRNSNIKFFKRLNVGILLILLTGISIFESNGQSPSKLVVNAKLRDQCRSGDANACEALGYSKPLATELAKIFRDKAKDPFSDRINKVKNVELLVAYFRISGVYFSGPPFKIEASRMTDMAHNDPDPDVRLRAISCCVDDLSLLLQLAKSDLSSEVRAKAVSKLKDPATLTEITKKDSSPLVRLAAVKKLTDNVFIATIAKNDADLDVRCQAISRITDENILRELFPQNPESIILLAFLRSPALYKDTTLLKQVIQHLPGSSEVQKNLGVGWWVLEPGSNFHFLPIEPAEGVEALSFEPNGEMFFHAGMTNFAMAKYALSEPQTLIVTRGGEINTYTLIVATNKISILSESKKAIYRRVRAPD